MSNVIRKTGGGSGAHGGFEFQDQVAAWLAVRILAETSVAPQYGLVDPGTTLESIRCESDQSVDDIVVETSIEGFLFFQVKKKLHLSKKNESEFYSVLSQFVTQYLGSKEHTDRKKHFWDRPLDIDRDRLILATSSESSNSIRITLRKLLTRIRNLEERNSITIVASSQKERDVLDVLLNHICAAWRCFSSVDPPDSELKHFLSLIHIQTLDLDENSAGRTEVGVILRTAILQKPQQENAAWSNLVVACAELATSRTSLDRKGFQNKFLSADILPRTALSYMKDIEKIREYSNVINQTLANLSEIRCGDRVIKIGRESINELLVAAKERSLLVVGEPGAGKTSALINLYDSVREHDVDAVLLAADRLEAASHGALQHDIKLTHDLVDVLDNWVGEKPGLLIIDAMDAVRNDHSSKVLLDVIQRVIESDSRWNVVASVRKYDLRYSPNLRNLFGSFSTTYSSLFTDSEFSHISHVNIPNFSEEEIRQVGVQSPELHEILKVAPTGFQYLTRVPFNLRLIAELIGEGITANELTPIRTQYELLTRYWEWRVIGEDKMGEAREAVLRSICEIMVKSRRLRAERAAITVANPTSLYNLLSSQVILEWQSQESITPDRSLIVFSHHVLFDFAVARLLLAGEVEKTVSFFANDTDQCIFVRPSLVFYFRSLWIIDRSRYWDLQFSLVEMTSIPEISRLIGPSVFVEVTESLEDLKPLLKRTSTGSDSAEVTLRHIIGSILNSTNDVFVSKKLDIWTGMLNELSLIQITGQIAAEMCRLTSVLVDRECTAAQHTRLGHVARFLLSYFYNTKSYQRWLIVRSIPLVCRTYYTNPKVSSDLLKPLLSLARLKEFGWTEMPVLAREVNQILKVDPRFVSEIYIAVFGFKETSGAVGPLGQSQLLPIVASRMQEYDLARYSLADAFPSFLEAAPQIATSACVAVLYSHFIENHTDYSKYQQQLSFEYESEEVTVTTDYSSIWIDRGHDDAIRILDSWDKFIRNLCEETNNETILQIVKIVVKENTLAVFWRHLLNVAVDFPHVIGRLLFPVAKSKDVLTAHDLSEYAVELLLIQYSDLDMSERESVENTITSIGNESLRNRVLARLPESELVTVRAKDLLSKLKEQNAASVNLPLPKNHRDERDSFSKEETLLDDDAPLDEAQTSRICELVAQLKPFCEANVNDQPSYNDVVKNLPIIRELNAEINSSETDEVHHMNRYDAAGVLYAAVQRATKCNDLYGNNGIVVFLKQLLIEGSVCKIPSYNSLYDSQFESFPSWGAYLPRIEVASGLLIWFRHSKSHDEDVLKQIHALSQDPVAAVRYHIAQYLSALYETAQDDMWLLLDHFAFKESNRGVLRGLKWPLEILVQEHANRVAHLAAHIYGRITVGPGAADVRSFCLELLTQLFVWKNNAFARDIIKTVSTNPIQYLVEAQQVLFTIRGGLTATRHDGTAAEDVQERTIALFMEIIAEARSQMDIVDERFDGTDKVQPEGDEENLRKAMHVLDNAGTQIYLVSGVKDNTTISTNTDKASKELLVNNIWGIIDSLSQVGTVPQLTHRLLEVLESLIPFNPEGVFLLAHKILISGQKGGYQFESEAIRMLVGFVERYLAEYRFLFSESTNCRRALIDILDIFVQVGWPEAQRLTYGIEDIFR